MTGTFDPRADGAVTLILRRLADGHEGALEELLPVVYGELRRIARGQRRRRGRPALLTTELVHEVYLRFARRERQVYEHRQHFFATAALAMKQILLDEAKSRLRHKRGGALESETLDPETALVDQQAELLIALERSLERLGRVAWRARRIVEYRYFGGLTEEETAELVGVDARTVRRDWAKARAWLILDLGLVAPGEDAQPAAR